MTYEKTRIHKILSVQGAALPLPSIGSWAAAAHRFDEDQLAAIKAAELAERPLLVRGEPGLGKSQIARAIATAMGWRLVTTVVNARTEIDDLLYSFDYIERLSEGNRGLEVDTPSKYIRPGPVWRALSENPDDVSHRDAPNISTDRGYYTPKDGCVLLIDEIDKAHPDIPNALLEVLNAGRFEVPVIDKVIGSAARGNLFIVITSNHERTLPAAFLRRCATLHLDLGGSPAERLQEIARSHQASGLLEGLGDDTFEKAANLIIDYRQKLGKNDYRPGTSEYLDLLRAISRDRQAGELSADDIEQRLNVLARYLVKKSHRSDQLI